MAIKLFDSELKVMEVLWSQNMLTAKEIATLLNKEIGWNKNTTYTVIKKCIEKGAINRIDPNFVCEAIVTKEEVQHAEVEELVNKLFGGSKELLFASLVGRRKISSDMFEKLKKQIEEGE
ncbi:MAG: BlaI/MecI/CopY family transcriptional regulator [Defluviitaleaceae bacterium]|nr:BlaI/MecI/CopY family transcriptional regulator [Defluviitaleaceae bacterium]